MATIGVVTVVRVGEEFDLYQTDAYPAGTGAEVLRWARMAAQDPSLMVDPLIRDIAIMDRTDIVELGDLDRFPVGLRVGDDWELALARLRLTFTGQFEIGLALDGSDLPFDQSLCEWGYLVDFNREVFEVYIGHQTLWHQKGHYTRGGMSDGIAIYPVLTWYLDALPAEDDMINAAEAAATRRWTF